ncbi:MAG: thioredoxin domain-containing protein [Candidatus Scalindua sp.]|nr:thioredoxin domain-containing protein [Candidatus Scalindua sp.]
MLSRKNCAEEREIVSRFLSFICFTILISGIFGLYSSFRACEAETVEDDLQEIMKMADEILAERSCPCRCGRFLPGSLNSPACFGCSAGKNEISYVLESLEAGKKPHEIIMDLNSPIIIDVFADYTDPHLPQIWQMVKKVSKELHQFRVILRAPGLTREALRALKLVESARLDGKYSIIQETLINHQGPWNWDTLIQLAARNGQTQKQTQASINLFDVDAQIAKDRQHARERGIGMFPAITINAQITPNTAQAIYRKIGEILRKESI